MTLSTSNPQDDEISQLLDKMYDELMTRRVEYMSLKTRNTKDIEGKLEQIENLEENFHSILKSHTAYWKFKKATGQGSTDHSANLLAKIREVSSNLGSIVSQVPKQ